MLLLLRDCLCLNLSNKPLQICCHLGKLQRLLKAVHNLSNLLELLMLKVWKTRMSTNTLQNKERDNILWTQSVHVAFIIFGYMLLSKASCWIFFGKHSTGWISQTSKWCVFHQLLLNHCAFIKAFDNFNCNYLFNDAISVPRNL